jgi:hypothetical protein
VPAGRIANILAVDLGQSWPQRARAGRPERKETDKPRYLIVRDVAGGFQLPITLEGIAKVREMISRNSDCDVTWVSSYVSDDKEKIFCVYDGPNPEAIRRAARSNGLPVAKITRITVLDPYFYS